MCGLQLQRQEAGPCGCPHRPASLPFGGKWERACEGARVLPEALLVPHSSWGALLHPQPAVPSQPMAPPPQHYWPHPEGGPGVTCLWSLAFLEGREAARLLTMCCSCS